MKICFWIVHLSIQDQSQQIFCSTLNRKIKTRVDLVFRYKITYCATVALDARRTVTRYPLPLAFETRIGETYLET